MARIRITSKERFVAPDYPDCPKWQKFSKRVEKLGFPCDTMFAPSLTDFTAVRESLGLTPALLPRRK